MERSFLKVGKKSRNDLLLSRYACVANDLPVWAKDILSSHMGSITVQPRDSFEIYLLKLKKVTPKNNYVVFCKKFAEIFEKKAQITLRKIQKNREQHEEFHISNDYFWQEFASLFTNKITLKHRIMNMNYRIYNFVKACSWRLDIMFKKINKSLKRSANSKKIRAFNENAIFG